MLRAESTGNKAFTIWDDKGVTAVHDCGHLCKWWVIDRFESQKGGCCNCRGQGKLTFLGSPRYVPCEVCIGAT